jgi:mannose-6-phosphate isomerase-like protein (cupin superfamily)
MNMTETERIAEPLPGGIGVTHLRVYDSVAPDGLAGGSPHMHYACSEAYLVVKGEGSVQTLTNEGFRETPLRSGSLLWFTPGVIHRLINDDGQLEIFAVMENAGLPEHGDSVLTFPEEFLRNEEAYLGAASLDLDRPEAVSRVEAARRRRDLAVEGFHALRTEVENKGSLQDFYRRGTSLIRSKEADWRMVWEAGPMKTILRTKSWLDCLSIGASGYLSQGKVFEIPIDPAPEHRKLGMCGTLRPYLPEGVQIIS